MKEICELCDYYKPLNFGNNSYCSNKKIFLSEIVYKSYYFDFSVRTLFGFTKKGNNIFDLGNNFIEIYIQHIHDKIVDHNLKYDDKPTLVVLSDAVGSELPKDIKDLIRLKFEHFKKLKPDNGCFYCGCNPFYDFGIHVNDKLSDDS